MILITNATPLIYLGKLKRLDLLTTISDQVVTTNAVKIEVLEPSAPEFGSLKLFFDESVDLSEPNNNQIDPILANNIHPGELSILNMAFDYHDSIYSLVIDDKPARKLAQSYKLSYTGTIGIILKNWKEQYLSRKEAVEVLDNLVLNTPFRLSNRLYIQIRQILN